MDKVKSKCLNCGEIFYGRKDKKYCSNLCISRYHTKTKTIKKMGKKEYRRCKNCNHNFLLRTSSPSQLFCNKECSKSFSKMKYQLDLKEGNLKNNSYLKLRFEVLKRDNFTCQYCGRDVLEDKVKLHIDHLKPISKNGKTKFDNLITACEECNLGKKDVLLLERNIYKINKKIDSRGVSVDSRGVSNGGKNK